MDPDFTHGMVRVRGRSGSVGTGFLVSAEGIFVTCAHILGKKLPDGPVTVEFLHSAGQVEALVLLEYWRPQEAEDVAFLHTEGALPDGLRPLPLGSSERRDDRSFKSHGFPKNGPIGGQRSSGTIRGLVRCKGDLGLLQLYDPQEITKGFSGGPVWDDKARVVVGMISDILMPDKETHRGGETSYAITTDTLQGICPQIKRVNPALDAYRRAVLEETRYVNVKGIPLIDRRVPLDSVYIRIQAVEETLVREEKDDEKRKLEEQLEASGIDPEDRESPLAAIRQFGEYCYRRGETHMSSLRPDPVDPEVALERDRNMVVLGAPGSGKSTLLSYLARRAAEDFTKPVPVLLSLRNYATALSTNSLISLQDFAIENAKKLCAGATPSDKEWVADALREAMDSKRVLWLLDALDEARAFREVAAREAAGLSRLGQLILTSRPLGYESGALRELATSKSCLLHPATSSNSPGTGSKSLPVKNAAIRTGSNKKPFGSKVRWSDCREFDR